MTSVRSQYVDPRGGRFAAWATSLVLSVVVLTGAGWLLLLQTAVFLAGAGFGLRFSPYAAVFRVVKGVARLGPPDELEAEAPLRFAQGVGAVFAVAGSLAFAAGWPTGATIAASFALAAAFLNAAFGVCLGCELYLIVRRLAGRGAISRFIPARSIAEGISA